MAFVTLDKTVTVSVDGKAHEVRSFSRTVGDVLGHEGIALRSHDVVVPSTGTQLHDGDEVVVRYGRLLTLDIDGKQRKVWTTALTLQEALDQIGLRVDGARLSASRSMPLGRAGLSVVVHMPKHVTFVVDGKRQAVETTAATVGEALQTAGIALGSRDTLSVDASTVPTDGLVVTVTRVAGRTTTVKKSIPFGRVTKQSASLYKDQKKVERPGRAGVRVLTYADTWTDGKLSEHKLVKDQVTQKPVDQIVVVGTKSRPTTHASVGGSVASLNWSALAQCESGGNPKAVNSSGPYYGLYQFTASTWHSVGGTGIPTDASASEQTYRAQLLYKRSGAGQWPVCGSKLYS